MKNEIPTFDLDTSNPDKLIDAIKFHYRIIEFVECSLLENKDDDLLCFLVDSANGSLMEARLPRSAFKQSLTKGLQFFIENEEYEICLKIKELLTKL